MNRRTTGPIDRQTSGSLHWNTCADSSTPTMLTLDENFREFLRLLNAHDARYLIVGGYAVAYHGFVRATGDLDLFVEASQDNAARILQALREFGFDVPELRPELFTRPKSIVRLGREPSKLEIMNDISGVDFETCYASREVALVDGLDLPFLRLDELLINKEASGRPKDRLDVDELRRLTRLRRGRNPGA